MDKLYHEFGPDGTNDLMIFFVDGSSNPQSTLALLQGASGSQGDWVTGTPYPIIGPSGQGNTLRQAYGTSAFPTLYMHCPGASAGVEISREATWEEFLSSWKNACPAAFANGAIDAHLLEVEGGSLCPGEKPFADVFNQGSGALTAAQLKLKQNGTVIETLNWTGSIAPFQHAEVDFATTTVTGTENFEMEVVVSGDANPGGNIEEATFSEAPNAPSTLVTLELITDNYASETTWKLFNSNGSVVAQDPAGNYANNQTYTQSFSLNPNECYTFTIYDSYGDGICCSYGQGSYKLRNSWGAPVIFAQGGQFGASDSRGFVAPATVGMDENTLEQNLRAYPNPTNGLLTLDLGMAGAASVEVFNVLGERVLSNSLQGSGARTIDLGALTNGIYVVNVVADGFQATRTITLSK